MPPFPYQKELIDIWLNAFQRTPLLMNFDEQQALTYGTEHGAGWRLDCLGDMRTNSDNEYFPAERRSQFESFQKKMGYLFILRRLEYPKAVNAGSMMPIHMWWLNAGVAPIYREFSLAVELRSSKSATIIRVPVDVRKWLPGDAVFDGTLYVPENLAEGTYNSRVAMLDPWSGQPAIRFAVEGRQDDGWYN